MSQAPAPLNLGRNDPCWCGSGRKYKKCHLPADLAKVAVPIVPSPSAASIQKLLHSALEAHQANRLKDAERIYRQVLRQDTQNADALHLLGVVLNLTGHPDEAIRLIQEAINVKPNFPGAFNNLGQVLKEAGRLEEAEAALRRAIELQPAMAEAHHNLGNVMLARDLPSRAGECYRRAIECKHHYPQAWYNLGQAQRAMSDNEQAIQSYRAAIQLDPNYAPPCNNLSLLLNELERYDEGALYARRAIAIQPDYAEAYNNLGVILQAQNKLDEAAEQYRQAIACKPDYAEAISNLGGVARLRGDVPAAIEYCRRAIALAPAAADPHHNLGIACSDLGDIQGALRAFERALELKPESPLYHWSRALALLVSGDFEQGWAEYEWRWKTKELKPSRMSFAQPEWDGSDPSGKTIFLYCEQGYGDALQFVRYATSIADRGAKVIVGCHPPIRGLIDGMRGVSGTWVEGEPLPPLDLHLPLLSLPRVLGTRLETIPNQVPYFHVDAVRSGAWRDRLANLGRQWKVGLVWAGNRQHLNDRHRSMPLGALAPLADLPDIAFISLQKGDAAAATAPREMTLLDYTTDLKDFVDTAALIQSLDLVITVDTSVAHLAGALGKAVWTLLAFAPDWRWLLERADSPWYPTMRLFRQSSPGDWAGVVQQVREALQFNPPFR